MKLFKYPVLVFDNIIKQLDPIPLVSLSFCSKKTKERIKRVSFAIENVFFGNEFDRKRGYSFDFEFPQQFLFVCFRASARECRKNLKSFSVRIGDIAYDCRYLIEGGQSIDLGCISYKKASIFFNYIFDLVRAGITQIRIDLNRLSNIKLFISEPCFKKVQKITLAGSRSVPGKKVDELYNFLEKPVLQTYVESHIKSLSPTSKLLQSENLCLDPSKFVSIEHLLKFSGKYINLESSSFLEEDIVAFVRHWLDGNYPNLEGVIINTPMEWVFETEKVLNEFNTKRWNPAERAQNFIFKASFSRDEKNEFPFRDCSNGHDLERSDGLMATIQFGEHNFFFEFLVWHTRFP